MIKYAGVAVAALLCRGAPLAAARDVLGRLVEVVSDIRFTEFPKARLFDPLDMRSTGFILPVAEVGLLATPFGGFKQPGFGRDRSPHAFEKYCDLKTTWTACQ